MYNSTFLTQKCTLGSHRVIYNSTFQSVSGGSRIATTQYRTHARCRPVPPRGGVLYTILLFCKQACDFESHRVIYNSTFLTQKCTLGSHRVIYNSTFQSLSGGSRIANRQYRTHTRCRPLPPRGVPGGELLLKTIDHKGLQLPSCRFPPIRDFNPTSLP